MTVQMEVVTVHNFHEKLSQWDEAHKQLFAIVDMGSNGIRFSISDLSPPRSRLLPCLYSERAAISLYDALHDHEVHSNPDQLLFSQEIISKVAKTLARFKRICDQYEVPAHQIDVFATAAMRSAHNRDVMLAEIKKKSGLDVKILEPSTESLFGAMGARSGFDKVDGLFMDLGGGSCQMTYVNCQQQDYEKRAAGAGESIPFGAARLTNELDQVQTTTESSRITADLNKATKAMYEALKSQSAEIRDKLEHPDGVHVYMCGGGFRGYGSMLMHKHEIQPYPIASIAGFTVSGKHFIRFEKMLKANEAEEKIFGLSKRRRKQFPAIIKVVEAVIAVVPRIKAVTFCTGSNREGALFMKLAPKIREQNPLDLFPHGLSTPHSDLSSTAIDTSSSPETKALESITRFLVRALPDGATTFPSSPFLTPEFLKYISKNIWVDMGTSDRVNSSRALRITTSGILEGLPGLTHDLRAAIALTLCARWGTILGPSDRVLYDNLQLLLGKEPAFLCQYIGTIARFLALFSPIFPKDEKVLREKIISILSLSRSNLGKKGHKSGIEVQLKIRTEAAETVDLDSIMDMFKGVGKGLGRKVEVKGFLMDWCGNN